MKLDINYKKTNIPTYVEIKQHATEQPKDERRNQKTSLDK